MIPAHIKNTKDLSILMHLVGVEEMESVCCSCRRPELCSLDPTVPGNLTPWKPELICAHIDTGTHTYTHHSKVNPKQEIKK